MLNDSLQQCFWEILDRLKGSMTLRMFHIYHGTRTQYQPRKKIKVHEKERQKEYIIYFKTRSGRQKREIDRVPAILHVFRRYTVRIPFLHPKVCESCKKFVSIIMFYYFSSWHGTKSVKASFLVCLLIFNMYLSRVSDLCEM